MATQHLIGIDLGGTFIKAAVVGLDGQVCSEISIETQAEQGPNQVIERLCLAAQQTCRAAERELSDMVGIGLGSPGPLNREQSVVIKSVNLPGWENVALRDRLSELTGLAVAMTNDASAATFGEFWAGAGRGARHLCMLTLGTGVGGGVIVDGQLVHGHLGNTGEFGHMGLPRSRRRKCARLDVRGRHGISPRRSSLACPCADPGWEPEGPGRPRRPAGTSSCRVP